MFYESLAFNEGGNDGFWRFQLRDRFGRWIKMGGSAMFEFRKPNDKNAYKAKGTFQGNIRRGWSIIRVGEGEQLPPGDYEIDSRYIESIKAIINTTSAKPETVDAPKSINPDVEKQAAEREMVAATVKDLEAGDIVQQSTEEALYGQINSVEHGDAESKINVTWSDGSNYDMTLPGDKKIKIWGAEPEVETVDAPKGEPVERNKVVDSSKAADEVGSILASRFGVDYDSAEAASVFKYNLAKNLADAMLADGVALGDMLDSTDFLGVTNEKPVGALNEESVFNKVPEDEEDDFGTSVLDLSSILESPYNDDTVFDGSGTSMSVLMFDDRGALKYSTVDIDAEEFKGKTLAEIQKLIEEYSLRDFDENYKNEYATYKDAAIIGTSASIDMITEQAVSRLIQTWAVSSNDNNARSLAIQETAKELFGLDKTSPWQVDEKLQKSIDWHLKSFGDVYKSLLTNQYKMTQEFLAEQGIKEFIAYRGFSTFGYENTINTGNDMPVSMRPLSSFSTNYYTASSFASGYGTDWFGDDDKAPPAINSYVIKTTVAAEDVFSMPGLGFGCLQEQELVVLGRIETVGMLRDTRDDDIEDVIPVQRPEPEPEPVVEAEPEPEVDMQEVAQQWEEVVARMDAAKSEIEDAKVAAIWGDAAPNERDVVTAAYGKLPADMPIADVAVLDPDFATYPDSIKNDPESVKEVAIGAMQELVRRWNGSSIYDDSTKALHEVAREHFGISGATPVEMTEGSKALMENKEAYKAVLDAIYASTQEMFANAGIEEITVYRGSKTDSSGVRPLSSWTTDKATAEAFAGKDGDTREMTVPVSQVLSTAMSGGLGAWNENEVVLLGSPKTVDAGNVEEEAPEVPEATRVIDNAIAAAEVNAALGEKVGVLSTSIHAAREFKKHAARVILDKMQAAGISVSQLLRATNSEGVLTGKFSDAPEEALDFETVVNKLPETTDIIGMVMVDSDIILNPPYGDDTVMGAGSRLNIMKFNDYGNVEISTIDVPNGFEMEGKTLKEIQTLAKEDPALRGFYGDFTLVGTSDSQRMFTESLTSKLVQNWADTSNDSNVRSLAIQDVAEELFGLDGAASWSMAEDLEGAVALDLKNHADVYKAFLQAQYDVTQEFFAEEGIKEFVLYRGFTSKFKVDTGYADTVLRPLSSFSTKKTQAEEFALPGGFDYGYLVEMTVPIRDILSVPGLGFGSYEEREVVVIGGKKPAFIEML